MRIRATHQPLTSSSPGKKPDLVRADSGPSGSASLRLLMIGNFLSQSVGTKPYCENLASQLEASGHRVVRSSTASAPTRRLLDMISTILRSRSKVDLAMVDVFSGRAFAWAALCTRLLSLLDVPTVLSLHGGRLVELSTRRPRRVRAVLKRGMIVVTPSKWLQRRLDEIREGIRYIPNGIDVGRYRHRVRRTNLSRLVWVRAFHRMYDPVTALRTLALVAEHHPNVRLAMVGPDKGDGSLEEVASVAESLGVTNRLEIRGSVPHELIPELLDKQHVFLNSTTAESFGVSVMEAAAAGLCIVTTDAGELKHLWGGRHDALVVPPKNASAMADAVLRILDEPRLAEQLSRNARAKAEEFDWCVVLPQWERLLAEVARSG